MLLAELACRVPRHLFLCRLEILEAGTRDAGCRHHPMMAQLFRCFGYAFEYGMRNACDPTIVMCQKFCTLGPALVGPLRNAASLCQERLEAKVGS